jgi:uncharacterized protein (DUF885 family)
LLLIHDTVLSTGAVPLTVLERTVRDYRREVLSPVSLA